MKNTVYYVEFWQDGKDGRKKVGEVQLDAVSKKLNWTGWKPGKDEMDFFTSQGISTPVGTFKPDKPLPFLGALQYHYHGPYFSATPVLTRKE